MQIYDFSSLWDIHAIFFGDSFSKIDRRESEGVKFEIGYIKYGGF